MRVAAPGGGHGFYAAVAEMTERGHDVWFWRRYAEAFKPMLEAKRITLVDARGRHEVEAIAPLLPPVLR